MGSADTASTRTAPRADQRNAATAAAGPLPRARVLVVDDDEHNLLAIRTVIEDLAEVETAASGEEALRHLLKGEFAVILLDVFMAGMDGYETAGLIRERDQTARIPIIFVSAVNKETEHLMRGYAMGAVDYVFKPVDPLVLKSKVSVFVDLYEMRLQVEAKSRAEQELRDAAYRAELEKLQIGRELEASRKRQAAIIQSLPIVLYMESQQTTPRRPDFVSGNLEAMTGFSFDEIRDRPSLWEERLHIDDRDRVMMALRERGASGRFSIEYRWKCANGRFKHFHDQAVLLRHDGEGAEFAGTLTDVSEQRMLESQLIQAQKMDAIGQLTGGIAHDFNNLLAAILGGIHILERRMDFSGRELTVVEQMRHAAEQGAKLVGRMMAFARKQDLTPASVDPVMLCQSVAGLVEHTLGGTVEIDWHCPHSSRNLCVAKSQLELALGNLRLNARDAMPKGGRVSVEIGDYVPPKPAKGVDPDKQRFLCIRVSDEGKGIPDHHLEKITEPFFTTKEAGKGTGLGLSMVLGFAQQSGGRLDIKSRVGHGSTIELILPATDRPVDANKPIPREPGTAKIRTVLLVDDDEAVRIVLCEQLRDLGMEVCAVADGAAAVTLLRDGGQFDLLLSDFAMPGLNGADTIQMAKELRPDVRTALMTGYADDESTAAIRDTIPILRKPIDPDELRRVLS